LHEADVEKLVAQLAGLVDAGNTVIVVEHDVSVVAQSDWVVDVGPGAGEDGGRVVGEGDPLGLIYDYDGSAARDLSLGAGRLRGEV
jgi:excinuclease ABC subunit A